MTIPDLDWTDHEEVVAQLNARVAYFRQQAQEWREECTKWRGRVANIENRLEEGHTPEQVLDLIEGWSS